jgi:signal transduction histidine kinase
MLADALADLDATIRVAEATVTMDAADDELVGDAALLRILVQNLVANAVKYSPERACARRSGSPRTATTTRGR